MRLDYSISDVAPYINWIYFFHAWGGSGMPQPEKARLQAKGSCATMPTAIVRMLSSSFSMRIAMEMILWCEVREYLFEVRGARY